MSNKLKITESQLRNLMERKHIYRDNSIEGDMEEGEKIGSESAIVKPEEEVNTTQGFKSARDEKKPHPNKIKWSDFVIGEKVKIIRGVEVGEEGILDGLSMRSGGASVKLDRTGDIYMTTPDCITPVDLVKNDEEYEFDPEEDAEEKDYRRKQYQGNRVEKEDEMMNESIKTIKTNFKRFL